jgi:hypothetical protein
VGLGGYGGFGSGGASSLLETERAAGGAALAYSEAQLKRLSLSAARVLAHLDMVACLVGVGESEEAEVVEEAREVGGEERRQELDVRISMWSTDTEMVAPVVAALAQARNLWVWGVEKRVADRAEAILARFVESKKERAGENRFAGRQREGNNSGWARGSPEKVFVCVRVRALMYGCSRPCARKASADTTIRARVCARARALPQAQRLPAGIVGISPAINDKHAHSAASGRHYR